MYKQVTLLLRERQMHRSCIDLSASIWIPVTHLKNLEEIARLVLKSVSAAIAIAFALKVSSIISMHTASCAGPESLMLFPR